MHPTPPRQAVLGAEPWTLISFYIVRGGNQQNLQVCGLFVLSFIFPATSEKHRCTGLTALSLHQRALKPDAEVHASTHASNATSRRDKHPDASHLPGDGREVQLRAAAAAAAVDQQHASTTQPVRETPELEAPLELPRPSADGTPTFHSAHGGERAQQEHRSPSGRRGRAASPLVLPHYPADKKEKSSQRNALLFH